MRLYTKMGSLFKAVLLPAVLAAPAYAHFSVSPPADCLLRDGTGVWFLTEQAADITLVRISRTGETVVLAFPEKRRGLTVRTKTGRPNRDAAQKLQTMIASPETFTLSDVAMSFDQDQYTTEIGYLSPELLRCMAKDN